MAELKQSLIYTHEDLQVFSKEIIKKVIHGDKLKSSLTVNQSTFVVLDKPSNEEIMKNESELTHLKPELRFETRNLPTLQPEDVQIRVYFGGLNFSDVYKYDGRFLQYTPLPLVLGMECTGKVEAVGSQVEDLKTGDYVVCYCSEVGLFGTRVIINKSNCYKIEEHQLFIASLLPTAYMTAELALIKIARMREGMSVLFNGVSGSVGMAVTDLVKNLNGHMYGVCSSHKIKSVERIGKFHKVLSYEQLEKNIVEEFSFDIVLDTHGGPAIERCLKLLKPFGTLVILGAAGVVSSKSEEEAAWLEAGRSIQTMELISKNISVGGAHLGMALKSNPNYFKNSMKNILDKFSNGEIVPCLQGVYDVTEIESALKLLLDRKNIGKIAIKFI